MWQSEKGIVLSAVRYNDKRSIVRVFTSGNGYVSYIFYLGGTQKTSRRNVLLQPLTQIEFQSQIIPNRQLHELREPKNASPYTTLLSNPVKSATALYIGEFLTHALLNETCNPMLFNFLSTSLQWFDQTPKSFNFHLCFMLHTATYLGVAPNPDEYRPGFCLDIAEGRFLPNEGGNSGKSTSIPAQLSYKLYKLQQADFPEAEEIPLTGVERNELLSALGEWFGLHIPQFPKLKSLEILRAVFE